MSLRRRLARFRNARLPGPSQDTYRPSCADEAEDAPWASSSPAPAPPPSTTNDARSARISELRVMINTVAERQARRARTRSERVEAALPGHRTETPLGPVRSARAYLPPEHHHGSVSVARALSADTLSLAGLALDARLADVDLSRCLFLDTETTGLGGGTGVVPFLVGLAWFEDGALVVEQLLLEELDEEPALLGQLEERLSVTSCVVTYNGKSYDWPLLGARSVMNRRPPLPELPHLDLLHCSRRVYKPRLGQVRLVDMEAEVLGYRRERDIDGFEIPDLYWSYLREGRAELLSPIIEHNANDVVALAALLAVLAERYAELHGEDDPRDQLARARVALRSSDLNRAELFARAAAEGGGRRSDTVDAFELMGRVRLKRSEFEAAASAWLSGVAAAGDNRNLAAPLHLELAKLYEHRIKRPREALLHAAQTARVEGAEAEKKRVLRLERKLKRAPNEATPELF